MVQYLKACLERAHVSILTSLQRKNNQVLVLFWFGCAYRTRFNVTCDVTTVLILFTQSFKVVSVEVRELDLIFFLTGLPICLTSRSAAGVFLNASGTHDKRNRYGSVGMLENSHQLI